jgi:hypothetical protein
MMIVDLQRRMGGHWPDCAGPRHSWLKAAATGFMSRLSGL